MVDTILEGGEVRESYAKQLADHDGINLVMPSGISSWVEIPLADNVDADYLRLFFNE